MRNNSRYSEFEPNIVVVGGGTGLSVILRGLKKTGAHISAIVTVSDDGGGSGVLRREMGMLPPGDVRNCILALANEEDIMEQLMQYRFRTGRLKNQNMGNLFIAALADIYGDFEKAVEKLHDILRIKGHVIPVTSEDITLCAVLEDGTVVRGESRIPVSVKKTGIPVKSVFLDPAEPEALECAIDAINSADVIVMGPGSLYSSIIPNLLVKGVSDSIREAGAVRILICGLMTQPGETDNFTVCRYAEVVEEYLGKNGIDYMLINNHICTEEELQPYAEHGSLQMAATDGDRKKLGDMGIIPVENNLMEIGDSVIRHNADIVSSIIISILHE